MNAVLHNAAANILNAQSLWSDNDKPPAKLITFDATTAHFNKLEDEHADAAGLKRGQLTDWEAIEGFIFAGAATFTLRSLKTGLRFTYKVKAKKQDVEEKARREAVGEAVEEGFVTYFVNLLRGPDNTKDFAYLGVLRRPGRFFTTPRSRVRHHPGSHQALVWFLEAMRERRPGVLGKSMEFWHTGRCGCCGRLLTVPRSVEDGIGPECARRERRP
jgi:hypothetical protein